VTLIEQSETIAARSLESDLDAALGVEIPDAGLCLRIAQQYTNRGEPQLAFHWLARVVDASDRFVDWLGAATQLDVLAKDERPDTRRQARVAVTGSYTLGQFAALFRLAALREGIDVFIHQGAYAQYQQDLLDPHSPLYEFGPTHILVAPHAGELRLSSLSPNPEPEVAAEVQRWTDLWKLAQQHSNATVIQHLFALRPEEPLGHLTSRLRNSRSSMAREVNKRLAENAPHGVLVVDVDRIASDFGKFRWFDDRYWHIAKQATALDALPVLARHTASVLAASLGLSRKCLVLDLDGVLWGGVIGEDGIAGIRLGAGAEGESFVAFQEYLLELKARGVILAVSSKNDDALARLPFETHPDMRLKLDDIAVFRANWEDKATNVKAIAQSLGIGLDALAFADDSVLERQLIRRLLPDVDVIGLPKDPASYLRKMADYLRFEPAGVTDEDLHRTEQYRAREAVEQLRLSGGDLNEFLAGLGMKALVAPFDEFHLPRITQLVAKTNQFNLTGRRYSADELRALMDDPEALHFYLRLKDRFTDHGLVGVLIGRHDGATMVVQDWLMSCRVLGRTVENHMFEELCRRAIALPCERLIGQFVATGRNDLVRDLYARLGFSQREISPDVTRWEFDLSSWQPANPRVIGLWDGQ